MEHYHIIRFFVNRFLQEVFYLIAMSGNNEEICKGCRWRINGWVGGGGGGGGGGPRRRLWTFEEGRQYSHSSLPLTPLQKIEVLSFQFCIWDIYLKNLIGRWTITSHLLDQTICLWELAFGCMATNLFQINGEFEICLGLQI